MNEFRIEISAGADTEDQLADILAGLDRETLAGLSVERELAPTTGLTGEPITISAVIGGAAIVISALLRVIERRLEHEHQLRTLKIVAEGFDRDPKLGEQLAGIAKKYADVSISYGIAKESWATQAARKAHTTK